jgi:hypothetical protein
MPGAAAAAGCCLDAGLGLEADAASCLGRWPATNLPCTAVLHNDFVEGSHDDDDVWAAAWRSLGRVVARLRRQRLIPRKTC